MMSLRAWLPAPLVSAACLLIAGGASAQQNPNPSFNLVNRGTSEVRAFFATSEGRTNWGRDRLDGKKLAAGAKFAVRLPADGNCLYDLRTEFADGKSEIRHGVNVCKAEDVEVGAHRFRLKNTGTSPITELQVRKAGPGNKATDLTQGHAIPPGAERSFDLPPEVCVFDLRATFETKQVREKRAADLCDAPEQVVK